MYPSWWVFASFCPVAPSIYSEQLLTPPPAAAGVSEPQVLSSWSQLQEAVAASAVSPAGEARGAGPGPLDAVLGVAGIAPRGTRIILVTEDGASAADSETSAVDGVARALRSGDLQVGTPGVRDFNLT